MNIYALELDNNITGITQRKEYIEALIARLDRPNLVILPELALCGCIGNEEIWQYADKYSRDTFAWTMKTAAKYNTYIAVGYIEYCDGDYYDSYIIADGTMVYGCVRRSEAESYIFKCGDFPNIISTPFGRVAVGICRDSHRRHMYDNIKSDTPSLIIFPHGEPSDPHRQPEQRDTIDALCSAYTRAFGVPVIYVNSVGSPGRMMGRTGKLIMDSGFRLCGNTRIYGDQCIRLDSDVKEAAGTMVKLYPRELRHELRFHGNDLTARESIASRILAAADNRRGEKYYRKHKPEL